VNGRRRGSGRSPAAVPTSAASMGICLEGFGRSGVIVYDTGPPVAAADRDDQHNRATSADTTDALSSPSPSGS
jgi:hypothetical protein